MNMNTEIVTRALMKAGQEPLTSQDKEKNSTRYRAIKSFYLSTILETLSKTNWTSQKKRSQLNLNEDKENLTEYTFCYNLPIDCAKPEELQDNTDYIVEGKYLYTDIENAILLYISSGYNPDRLLPDENESFTEEDEIQTLSEDLTDEVTDETEESEEEDNTEEPTEDEDDTEDYPEYDELILDPMLSLYIETMLAAKIALKITGEANLYQLLYNEAALIEQRAEDTSHDHSKNRTKGSTWWTESLGLGD